MGIRRLIACAAGLFAIAVLGGGSPRLYGADDAPASHAAHHDPAEILGRLEGSIMRSLEVYSNVHRGEGQFSMASTALYERAREVVREYLGLGEEYEVIFGSIREIDILAGSLKDGADHRVLYSDLETGLRFGVGALAVGKAALPEKPPVVGGGEVDDVSDTTVAWSDAPAKFEPGTPNITGAIAFARALGLIRQTGDKDIFRKAMAMQQPPEAADPFAGMGGRELLAALRKELIGGSTRVPSEQGMVGYINLDNGASTPTFGPIAQAALAALRQTDQGARRIVADGRAACADFFNAPAAEYECVFTSNTTESINIAAEIAATFGDGGARPAVVGTDLEHNSNELPWRNVELVHAPVDDDGFIDLGQLERLLKDHNGRGGRAAAKVCMVTVSGASNVLGTFNDLGAISGLAHRCGAVFHVDAAQLAAHRRVDMAGTGIDLLSCSGHKMYAPFGTGCFVARKELLRRLGEDRARRIAEYGDRNIMGIAALARSMRYLEAIGLDLLEKDERVLTSRLLRGLADLDKTHGEGTILIFGIRGWDKLGDKGPVVAFHVDGIPHNIVAARLAETRGIGVRTGCFCAHRLLKFLFDARGKNVAKLVREGAAPGLVRASIGLENTAGDIDALLAALAAIIADPDNRKFIPGDPDCRYCAGKALVAHPEISKEIHSFVRGVVRAVYGEQ